MLGDFNAHLELLEDRKEDINGEMVLRWLDEYDLILMNADEKCEGVYTWSRGYQKSGMLKKSTQFFIYHQMKTMGYDEENDGL